MKTTAVFVLCWLAVLGTGFASASAQELELKLEEEAGSAGGEGAFSRSHFSLGAKIVWHAFLDGGLLDNGARYGRPGLGSSDLYGVGGDFDLDYHLRDWFVLTATVGLYEGHSGKYDLDILTGYALLTAKLQNPGKLADYYIGVGGGGYVSRMEADGTATALKPGVHVLVGIRIHVNESWSVLLEDRLAWTLTAKDGFGDLNLGGNFLMLGCGYRF